jgi:hypothetical protein
MNCPHCGEGLLDAIHECSVQNRPRKLPPLPSSWRYFLFGLRGVCLRCGAPRLAADTTRCRVCFLGEYGFDGCDEQRRHAQSVLDAWVRR